MAWCSPCVFDAVVLLIAANGAPLLARMALGDRYAWPVDGGIKLRDGQTLFGNSKTWRGVIAAVCLTVAAAWLLGLSFLLGGVFAVLTMLGDLSASFCKRRMGKVESSRARGLDTVPESLLPVWVLKGSLHLNGLDIVLVIGLFFLLEEFLPLLLGKWHSRGQPY